MLLALDILERSGLTFLSRWAHVLVGITWIGLLYYFNFVQVPAFAEFDAGSRNVAVDKLASRALWWFRWAAAATFAFGIMILLLQQGTDDKPLLFDMDYYKTPSGISILTGVLLGITMFFNVWLVIWPGQKVVIANARNVIAGGEADPNAAAVGRKALLASRQNTIFSFPMLFFMVGTSHFFSGFGFDTSQGQNRAFYWVFVIVMWSLLEANCLGYLGGTAPGGTRKIYDDHKNTIVTGFILVLLFYLVYEVAFTT